MLTRIEKIASIDISPSGVISVAVNIDILEGGDKVAQAGRRYDIVPGADYGGYEPEVRAVCAAIHTPGCIAAYQAEQASGAS